MLALVAGHIT